MHCDAGRPATVPQLRLFEFENRVAGDIIRTVIVSHSLSDVASLGLIVVIRTVLVFTIHLEVEGRWPWQRLPGDPSPPAAS